MELLFRMNLRIEICFLEQLDNCAIIDKRPGILSLSGSDIFSQMQPELDMISASNR